MAAWWAAAAAALAMAALAAAVLAMVALAVLRPLIPWFVVPFISIVVAGDGWCDVAVLVWGRLASVISCPPCYQ
jgi:hypothetical protein